MMIDSKMDDEDEGQTKAFLDPPDITLKIVELNPHLTCHICKGYLRDAATITECLHSFCKSCIVQHFMESIQCPRCRILVHPTNPLTNLRLDSTLTDIVNKTLPHLLEGEWEREVAFYRSRNLPVPTKETQQTKTDQPDLGYHDDLVSIVLQYKGATEGLQHYKPVAKNYVRVSGKATIRHVQKFISRHMELDDHCYVCLFCNDYIMKEEMTLHDMLDGGQFKQDSLLQLNYGITKA